jgi:hypothetical protein
MSPKVKQFLSALGVALLGAGLAFLQKQTGLLSPTLQVIAVAVLGGVAHFVPALGTEQATVDKLAGK